MWRCDNDPWSLLHQSDHAEAVNVSRFQTLYSVTNVISTASTSCVSRLKLDRRACFWARSLLLDNQQHLNMATTDTPKAVLYISKGSLWASVPRLALIEKVRTTHECSDTVLMPFYQGYTADECIIKEVDLRGRVVAF